MLKKIKLNFKSPMVLGSVIGGVVIIAGTITVGVLLGTHKGHVSTKTTASTASPQTAKTKAVTLGTGGGASSQTKSTSTSSSNTASSSTSNSTGSTSNSASKSTSSVPTLSSADLHIYIPATKGNFVVVQDQGQTMVIDGGVSSDVPFIKKYLKKLGISKVKYLVVSNNLFSSIQGLPKILSLIPATYYLSANDVANGINSKDVLDWFNKNNLYWQVPTRNTQFNLGKADIKMVTTNDGGALLILVKDGSKTFLFTGTSTVTVSPNVLSYLPSHVSVYSVTDTDKFYNLPKGILSSVKPKTVIFNDASGASDSTELSQIQSLKSKLYTLTGKDGIVITSDGSTIQINQGQTEGVTG